MGILNKIIKKKKDESEKKGVEALEDIKDKQENEAEVKKTVDEKEIKKETEDKKEKKETTKNSKTATDTKKKKKEATSKMKKVSSDKIPNHYFDLIKKPHISEKTFNLSNKNQYVFIVSDKSNKSEIKKAVRSLYGVSVISVNIVNIPSKPKKFKGRVGIKSGYKKAIVKLAEGNKIDLMKEAK